jgi:N-acyl-phosphatidylethanolamine-hydrolysing phospholipase D
VNGRMRAAAVVAGVVVTVAVALAADPPEEPDVATLYAPHFEDGEFFNPWQRFPHRFGDLLWWVIRGNPYDKSAAPDLPVVANDGRRLVGRESSASVTFVGHATVAVHDDDDVFLTDPHFGPRALLPGRWTPPGIPIEAVPPDAFAVISHNHYDHLDAGTVDRLPETIDWYVPLGLADWFRARGRERVVELDWWQSAKRGRWTITCLPSQHWSRRIWQGTNTTLWCSWLLDNGERRYYFAGDTGYFHGFREFAERFGPIDVALLPIGAFEPRDFMRYQHLNPEDAVRAFLDLDARWLVPVHWGCFDLAFEPLDLPPKLLEKAVAQEPALNADRVRILAVGERWEIPGS